MSVFSLMIMSWVAILFLACSLILGWIWANGIEFAITQTKKHTIYQRAVKPEPLERRYVVCGALAIIFFGISFGLMSVQQNIAKRTYAYQTKVEAKMQQAYLTGKSNSYIKIKSVKKVDSVRKSDLNNLIKATRDNTATNYQAWPSKLKVMFILNGKQYYNNAEKQVIYRKFKSVKHKQGYQLTYVEGDVTQVGKKAFYKYGAKFDKLYNKPQLVIKQYQQIKMVKN